MLAAGNLAPDFELNCTPDQKLKLSELSGKKIILAMASGIKRFLCMGTVRSCRMDWFNAVCYSRIFSFVTLSFFSFFHY